jgi:hypothetical protein
MTLRFQEKTKLLKQIEKLKNLDNSKTKVYINKFLYLKHLQIWYPQPVCSLRPDQTLLPVLTNIIIQGAPKFAEPNEAMSTYVTK